jgi:hypothetical protein
MCPHSTHSVGCYTLLSRVTSTRTHTHTHTHTLSLSRRRPPKKRRSSWKQRRKATWRRRRRSSRRVSPSIAAMRCVFVGGWMGGWVWV